MPLDALEEIKRTLDKVGGDIWDYDDLDGAFDDIQQRLSRLEAQLHVQRSLQRTAKLLQEHIRDKVLPNQLATRVKHFIRFTFEKESRDKNLSKRLRGLECNALKFCGLTYKLKDVLELPAAQVDFLVANVEDFVHRQGLSQHLYRDDVDKVVYGKFDPEDDVIFKEFLKSHVEHRPAKRKRDGSAQHSLEIEPLPPVRTAGLASQALSRQQTFGMIRLPRLQQMVEPSSLSHDQTQTQSYRQFVTTDTDSGYDGISGDQRQPLPRPSIHHSTLRDEPEHTDHTLPPSKENREIKYMYTNAPASHISKMPEPFRTAIKESRLWKWERSHNMKTTGCWPSLFPKDNRQDVSFTIWCGHEDGYQLTDFFGSELASS